MAKFQPKVADEGRDDGMREKMIAVNRDASQPLVDVRCP